MESKKKSRKVSLFSREHRVRYGKNTLDEEHCERLILKEKGSGHETIKLSRRFFIGSSAHVILSSSDEPSDISCLHSARVNVDRKRLDIHESSTLFTPPASHASAGWLATRRWAERE
jgi:hypothetical protein